MFDTVSNHVLLIDGHNALHRCLAIHGQHTLNGWAGMVRKWLREGTFSPKITHAAIMWDPPGPTWRHVLTDKYKANRSEQSEQGSSEMALGFLDFLPQAQSWAKTMGFHNVVVTAYEADDALASAACAAESLGWYATIVTSDKDMAQCVSPHVRVRNDMLDVTYTHSSKKVQEKWGVDPHLIPDFLAIVGDKSDNIVGLPGFGPVKAIKLLSGKPLEYHIKQALKYKGEFVDDILHHLALLQHNLIMTAVDKSLPINVKEFELGLPDPIQCERIASSLGIGEKAWKPQRRK